MGLPRLPLRGPPDSSSMLRPLTSSMLRLCMLVLLAATLEAAERPRRAEMSPVPFVMGSRYGRSSERVMAPRNDRFFMGSRYGKRAERAGVRGVEAGCAGGECRLLCVPLRPALEPQRAALGTQRAARASQLYKCVRDLQHTHYISRSLSDVLSVTAGDSEQ